MTNPVLAVRPPVAGASAPFARLTRLAGAALVAAHGLVHLIGAALLWRLAEPGELTYDETVPTPGTALAYVDGVLWAVAAIVSVCAAVLVVRRRPQWRGVALAGAALSTVIVGAPLLAGSHQGVAGVVTDALVVAGVTGSWLSMHRRMS